MNILILTNNDVGLYKFRKELIETLLKDHKVFISLPNGDFVSELIDMGCEFYECNFDRHGTNPLKELRQIFNYKKLIKHLKPDIVLTYTIKPNIYGGIVCTYLKIPFIVTITGLGAAVENGGIIQKITLTLYKLALRKAEMVFFQNSENLDFMLKHHVVKNNFCLLPGSGVNLVYYKLLEYPPQDVIEFAFISRIMKEKGIDQYLDAAKYIRKKYPNTKFHVCGFCEDAYEDKLKELNEKGIIIYHGMVRDVRTILKDIHCTIHPTYYPEGLSNVLLESCACGRPIITTDRSGCREVIEDGVNGFVCKQKDSEDLIKQIEKFIALPYEKKKEMGIAGRAKVEKEFDRQLVVNAYIKEIKKISE
jgi:glycosyltransferase involved in cell wall biosynthesis